jgi:hypothetical protein
MKKTTIVSVLAIIALLSFACRKNEVSQALANAVSGEDDAAASSPQNYGYVLRLNASFCIFASDDTGSESDKVKWAASMSLGDRVTVGETRRLTYEDGTLYDFTKIRRDDGSEGLAFAAQVVAGGQLAVVVDEKTNLFKSPKAVDVTGTLIPPKTLVVCYPETDSGGFVEIKGYEAAIRQGGYVRLSSLSRKNSDIQSSILLQTAIPLKDTGTEKIKKDALLEMALLEYPDSLFYTEILALVNPNAASVIQTEPASHSFMIVNDDNVNVRSVPDTVAGRVIDSLNEGDAVRVTEQTVAESVIDGERAHWYHISSPVDGWVFGAFLDFTVNQ